MGVTIRDLTKTFISAQGETVALRGINLTVNRHDFVSIVGPSGCGKSTLLRIIAELIEPTSGEIIFESVHTKGMLRTALVFQHQGLFPWMTVRDNVAFPLEARGMSRSERYERVGTILEHFGLAGFDMHYPNQLSGGMRQRVALARAFFADPEILLMDEPFGALDAQTKLLLQQFLLDVWKTERKTVIYVTHDIEEAIMLGDRVYVMTGRPGRIREEITIPLPRPRDLTVRKPAEVSDIKWHIWKMLEDEVRNELVTPRA